MGRYADTPGSEAFIKRDAVAFARAVGFVVLDTATNRRNPRPGIPDAFFSHPRFGNRWLAVDFKRPSGSLTTRQSELVASGILAVADSRSTLEALLRSAFPGVLA